MTRTINVADHVKNVVSNLRAADPRYDAEGIADWRIDYAHRIYSTSEDFGDDSKVYDWLPDDTEERQWEYVHMQMGDMWRTIHELEQYNTTLVRELREARQELRDFQDGVAGDLL